MAQFSLLYKSQLVTSSSGISRLIASTGNDRYCDALLARFWHTIPPQLQTTGTKLGDWYLLHNLRSLMPCNHPRRSTGILTAYRLVRNTTRVEMRIFISRARCRWDHLLVVAVPILHAIFSHALWLGADAIRWRSTAQDRHSILRRSCHAQFEGATECFKLAIQVVKERCTTAAANTVVPCFHSKV